MPDEPSFLEKVEALPLERKQAVQSWFGTMMFIAKELDLDPDTWFGYLEWALTNPFDFTFVFKRSQSGRAPSAAELKKAQAAIGAVTGTKQPGGGGPGNIVGFMVGRDKDQKKGG